MRRRRSELVAILLVIGAAAPAAAQDDSPPVEGGATFLLLPVGAKASALGQAGTADGASSESAFWNPAGLARLDDGEIGIHFSSTFASNNTAIAAAFPVGGLGVVGLSGYLVDFGSQEVVTGPGPPQGRISVKNFEVLGSYATEIVSRLSFGLNYKLVQFRQDCSGDCGSVPQVVGTSQAVDVGLQYGFGRTEPFRVGVAVKHAGFKLQVENRDQADPLPTRVELGMSYRVTIRPATDTEEALSARFLADVHNEWGTYDNPDARLGVELGYGSIVSIRSGYAILHSQSSGPSIGIGLRIGRIAVDFARIFYDSGSFDEPVHLSLRASI